MAELRNGVCAIKTDGTEFDLNLGRIALLFVAAALCSGTEREGREMGDLVSVLLLQSNRESEQRLGCWEQVDDS